MGLHFVVPNWSSSAERLFRPPFLALPPSKLVAVEEFSLFPSAVQDVVRLVNLSIRRLQLPSDGASSLAVLNRLPAPQCPPNGRRTMIAAIIHRICRRGSFDM